LASANVLRPVASVGLFVVQEPSDAELLGRRSVPASPVAGARRFVSENTIKPVAMLSADGGICEVLSPTYGGVSPGVIAPVGDPPVLSYPNQAVGAVVELLLPREALPISVAVSGVRHHLRLGLTGILLLYLGPRLLATDPGGGCCQDEDH